MAGHHDDPFDPGRDADRPRYDTSRSETRGTYRSDERGGNAALGVAQDEGDDRTMRSFQGPTHEGKGPKSWRRSDERIHDDVCRFLTLEEEVDASGIDVKVEDGVVTLSGAVPSRFAKRLADVVAHGVIGVRDVMNELEVRAAH